MPDLIKHRCKYCARILFTGEIIHGSIDIYCRYCKLTVKFVFVDGEQINKRRPFGVMSVQLNLDKL